MLKVSISWDSKLRRTLGNKFLEKFVKETFQEKGWVGIVFCDEKTIRRLNRKYRKVDRVTDVLTFPVKDPYSQGLWGEVFICLPRARRQAKEYGHTLKEEITLLLSHGLKGLLNGISKST